jgi:hypothetical protein
MRDALLTFALLVPHTTVTAAPPGTAPQRTAIVSILCDADASGKSQEQAWFAIDGLPDPDRDATLRDLVALANERYALSAMHVLIYGGSSNIDILISDRILSFSQEGRISVLRAIVLAERSVELGRVPRRLLEQLIETGPGPDSTVETLDVAGVLVGADGNAHATQLLRESIRRHPWSRGLWTGLTLCRGVGAQDLPLALSIQYDGGVPLVVRTAAAVAVAAHVDGSARFARQCIGTYIQRFGPMTLEQIARALGSSETDVYDEFWDNLRLIGMLRHLVDPRASDLAIDALQVENEAIRQVAAAVIVERWPDQLLSIGRGRLDDAEYAGLLVLLGVHHPTLRARATACLPVMQIDEAHERLSQFGQIGLLEWAGPVMAGF